MAKSGEATLLLKIKEIGGEILDRFVITFGDVVDAAKAVFGAMMETIDAFKENEDAVKSLNQAMINAGTFSAELQNEYLDMASALQKVTTFGDEQIISAQALLQAHVGSKKVTEELTRATLDFATAKKMDLASAAELIGKSISSETNALGRYGIQLDEAAAKSDKLGAVVSALDKKFGGQAEAAARGLGAIDRLKNSFSDLMEVIGERLAPIVASFASNLASLFDKITTWTGQNSLAKKSTYDLGVELAKIQDRIEKLSKMNTFGNMTGEIEQLKKRYAEVAALQEKQFQDEQTSLQNKLENEKTLRLSKDQETWMALQEQKIAQQEMEIAQEGANYEQKLAAEIALLNKRIQNETDFQEKKKLMQQKYNQLELLEGAKANRLKFEEQQRAEKEMISNRSATLNTIATLQRSNNSTLAAIGKAAAITEIAIQTPVAIARALAAFPPPFNFAAAGLVGAAMAAQAAQIAGVQLAEGGIVRATQGGVPAIIGEGGRDEAVIPLENGRVPGMGTTINIVVNGGLLGDEAQARELARALDQQLYKLRLNNESVSFDGIS